MDSFDVKINELDFKGNILDLSVRGRSTIPKILDKIHNNKNGERLVKDYIKFEECSSEREKYDTIVAYFSLGILITKKQIDNVIKTAKNMMQEDGKLLIWELNNKTRMFTTLNIKTILNNDKSIITRQKVKTSPFKIKYNELIGIIKNADLDIEDTYSNNEYFYIKAINAKDNIK